HKGAESLGFRGQLTLDFPLIYNIVSIRFRNYFDSSFRSLISLLTRALLSISLCHIAYYIILKK
ncbi:hypothetical protein KSX67_15790, partial [Bacteroides uniformis]|uniref:hypothetical protein n=1 Tax=Bacteroides uniformis TaxID=820 RepID=UPI001C37E61D